jgi:hypothetical protein
MHPYQTIQDFQHWTRAMSMPAPGHVDPVTRAQHILPGHKVATMGSCFAQHISRHLSRSGCTFFVTETAPPNLTSQEAAARNFGVFSARYGNVYTVRQAIQLFQRAFGNFTPLEKSWHQGDRLVDPFRPTIESAGFSTVQELERSREDHFAAVRRIFLESDWLIFTLGLTEAWRDRCDGAVFPVAPGVSGGDFDDSRYEFVNFGVDEVRSDLAEFLRLAKSLKPGLRVLLTVSPVPLVATYEKRHVWSSTVTSKSVLRVAADEAEKQFSDVIYFPSFEVITSPAAGGRYYHDDLRQVTETGVKHVMRLFTKHFLSLEEKTSPVHPLPHLPKKSTATSRVDVVCDEETIEHAIRQGER